ncbi:MAG: type II 3-dehydroquinate dehydratase [Pseudomonadota bacterium]|nr:type II 3-dehydroquinate dehydratase [Pseudomonadota bacterium]
MTASPRILAINGPNLNMLGTREPEIYGADSLTDMETRCRAICEADGATLDWMHSNGEGDIVTTIQQAVGNADWIVINAAALTHTSVALRDALALFPGGKIEVHLSNIHKRETFRHHSMISAVVDGVVLGFGPMSYVMAIRGILEMTREAE